MKPPTCPYCEAENTRLCCLTAFYVALADYPEDQDMEPNICSRCGANLTADHQCRKHPCPYLDTNNLTCSHPDIPFYDIICSQEVCPNA